MQKKNYENENTNENAKVIAPDTIYIRIPTGNTTEDVNNYFNRFGKIKHYRPTELTDKFSGLQISVGFIEYEEEASAAKAIVESDDIYNVKPALNLLSAQSLSQTMNRNSTMKRRKQT